MAKDPAVLFYTSDFISGTITMTDEERGRYILLLCLQHQKGRLTDRDMETIKDMQEVQLKFERLEDGFYYNIRMKEEAEKRKSYSESRRNNRKSKIPSSNQDMNNISSTHDNHIKNISLSYLKDMENENEDLIKDLDQDLNVDLNTTNTNTGNLQNIVEKLLDVLVDYDSDIKDYNLAIDDYNELGGIDGVSEILGWDTTQKTNWNRKIQNVYELK
jgi:hypothetical protein